MKWYNFVVVILFFGCVSGNIVSNVRLVDFPDFIINVITTTVKEVEQRCWCNLKVADVSTDIDEVVLGWHAKGTLHYKNGFVNSIQAVDIRRDTVQSQVNLNTDRVAQAIVRGTLRMHDVAIGYDVEAVMQNGTQHYTATYVHPLINFAFTITKIIGTENYAIAVVVTVPASRNLPSFRPTSKATDVYTTLFDPTMSVPSIISWGTDVFQPIATELVPKKIKFPTICYNCAA